jgi:hypothetical protein
MAEATEARFSGTSILLDSAHQWTLVWGIMQNAYYLGRPLPGGRGSEESKNQLIRD